MQRTLIAVFDNRGNAQSALEELVAAGFAPEQVRLSSDDPTGRAAAGGRRGIRDSKPGSGILDSIRNFFGNILGTDDSEYVQKYSDAVTRGHQVLTLSAAGEQEIGRAVAIVERWSPVDVDQKAAEWNGGPLASEAMRGGPGAQQRSAQMAQQSSQGGQGAAQGSMQGSDQPGAQQRAADSGAGGLGAGAGARVSQHMAEPSLDIPAEALDSEEVYFRSHYNSNYAGGDGSYDDYAPAYRYGAEMANSETYRGRPWRDVEPQLRSDWEGRNPGSAWAKFKAAVRHGWERITH